jgi:hypothetical protein
MDRNKRNGRKKHTVRHCGINKEIQKREKVEENNSINGEK